MILAVRLFGDAPTNGRSDAPGENAGLTGITLDDPIVPLMACNLQFALHQGKLANGNMVGFAPPFGSRRHCLTARESSWYPGPAKSFV